MSLDWNFIVFVGALSIAAFSPGPGLAALVATVLANGARKTIWFCTGIILGDLAWLTLSLSGLALIAQQVPIIFAVVKWIGVIYLIYLAIKIWRSQPEPTQFHAGTNERSPIERIMAGFMITMGNPKAMLIYLALLPSIVSPDSLSIPMVAALAIAVIGVLSLALTIYALAAEKARSLMTNNQSVRTFNRITASALGGAATWIASR